MIISCFGCSFTGGVYEGQELRESWPYRLSQMLPQHKIYNFGRQATSVLYSINMIEQSIEQIKPDLILSQLTEPIRMTFYDSDFRLDCKKHLIKITDNYFVLSVDLPSIHPINAVSGKKQLKEIMLDPVRYDRFKTFEKIFTLQDDYNHFDPEYRSLFYRADQLSNFVFFHRKLFREVPGLEHVPCVEKELGTDDFLKLVIDKGFHFGQPGAEWIAQWINQKLNLSTID